MTAGAAGSAKSAPRPQRRDANTTRGHFKGYSLKALDLPEEAYPDPSREHLGAHSYTIVAENESAPRQKT